MSAIQNIKKMFVLMLENRSYDNVFGWSDLRGWTPNGVATQADGLLGKPPFQSTDASGHAYAIAQGAPFRLAFDPGHEFTDTLVQSCGGTDARHFMANAVADSAVLQDGVYPPPATSANDLGFACDLGAHGYDIATGLRAFTPDQLPVLNFLAQQFAVCDRWFSSMPGPTWPNRFFALAGTSWGLDHSPSDSGSITSSLFDGAKFGNGGDSLLTRLAPTQWLVAHGDIPQSWALKGVDAYPSNFLTHADLFASLASGNVDASFVFIEPAYDPIGNFRNGESMHPCGDVRSGDALVERVYNAIRTSPYWEESVLLILFDEHGGFFDHVIPHPTVVSGMPALAPVAPTGLTKRGFRFDRYGFRVPAVVVSPYVKQATVDHTFYDHLSMAKTLAKIVPHPDSPLLDTQRFADAADLSALFVLSQPRKADEIHACPHALPVAPPATVAKVNNSAVAFNSLNWPVKSIYAGA